jgi:menaquinol-cytochrome c reductase iron-sulfur subunit
MSSPSNRPADDRRGFLADVGAVALAAGVCAVPAATALVTFLAPWRQKSEAGELRRVTSLSALTVGGPPQQFPIIADRCDAWNRYPAQAIGSVFLRRTGEQEVEAFQVLCPHAGCGVMFDAKAGNFYCPCHEARFDLAGERLDPESSMSPRSLDTLEVEVRDDAEVWVKFEKFRTGTSEKTPEA